MRAVEPVRCVLTPDFVRCFAVGTLMRSDVCATEGGAGDVEGFPAAAVGEDAEVADLVEAPRQDMHHEAGDERLGCEGLHAIPGLALSWTLWTPASEPHVFSVESEDAAVPYGDAVSVSRQIPEDLPCPLKWPFGIDDPVLAARPGKGLAEGVGFASILPEHDLAAVMRSGEFLHKTSAEIAGENLDGSEEVITSGFPVAGFDIEAGIGDNAMQVWMP